MKPFASSSFRFVIPKWVAFGVCSLSSLTVSAQEWRSDVVKIKADPKQAFMDVGFEYSLGSPSAPLPHFGQLPLGVTLLSEPTIDSQASSMTFRFRIPIGNRPGERVIQLPYAEQDGAGAGSLRVEMTVPESTQARPRLLTWNKGGHAEANGVSIVCITCEGFELVEAVASEKTFNAILSRQADHLYTLTVTPSATDKVTRSLIQVRGHNELGEKTVFNVHVVIR